jgi:hypothetical protein
MSDKATVRLEDIPADVRKKLNLRVPRKRSMTVHEVRTAAFRIMSVVADLTPAERARVLRQATRLNEV